MGWSSCIKLLFLFAWFQWFSEETKIKHIVIVLSKAAVVDAAETEGIVASPTSSLKN